MAGAASGSDAGLKLKPSVCALEEHQSTCREYIDIHWQVQAPSALCLYVSRQSEPLECWQDARRGQFQHRVDTDESLVFQLRDSQENKLLASEAFEVIREHTEYRSRRRKPWNFF